MSPIPPIPPGPIARIANWRQLTAAAVESHTEQLSAAERQRLNGFRDAASGRRFVAGRMLAHSLLRHCDPAPARWRLAASGPPLILDRPDWHLSISHSGDWIAAALGPLAIGIDVEDGLRRRRYLDIARHYFHPSEAAALATGSDLQRQRRFLLQWTTREAYLKATGDGIAGGLRRLRVDFDPAGKPGVSLCDGGDRDWLFAHYVEGALTICVAWRGADLDLHHWDWNGGANRLAPLAAGAVILES